MNIGGISLDRLLRDWKWLVPDSFRLLAVNAFGDLFLEDVDGGVHRLDITAGNASVIANSQAEFESAAREQGNHEAWFLVVETSQAERKGLSPGKAQCVGTKIPWVIRESADVEENMYVADLYEYVSFMGDFHRQIKNVPDGGSIEIKIQSPPTKTG